jgi:hypothetical protein
MEVAIRSVPPLVSLEHHYDRRGSGTSCQQAEEKVGAGVEGAVSVVPVFKVAIAIAIADVDAFPHYYWLRHGYLSCLTTCMRSHNVNQSSLLQIHSYNTVTAIKTSKNILRLHTRPWQININSFPGA